MNSLARDHECPLCSDGFSTIAELNDHKAEHLEEIENMDVASLTNGHDVFECNLCSFESGHEDSVKEHMIEHVNSPPKKTEETVKQSNNDNISSFESGYGDSLKEDLIQQLLLEEFDSGGNYIGNDSDTEESAKSADEEY